MKYTPNRWHYSNLYYKKHIGKIYGMGTGVWDVLKGVNPRHEAQCA